jgi:flagellar basal-body rod protein FlgB
MLDQLGGPLLQVLHKALDASWLRQQVIANNIANVETPGYKRWEVSFEKQLQRALAEGENLSLARTHPAHFGRAPSLGDVQPQVYQVLDSSYRNDGNNVDIDAEMAKQTANYLNYNLLTRLVTGHLEMLRIAVTEGRR